MSEYVSELEGELNGREQSGRNDEASEELKVKVTLLERIMDVSTPWLSW